MDPIASRLFVCYVPGFDRRRVGPERTPFVDRLLAEQPSVDLTTTLATDLLPTLITGVGPGEHRIWGVSLGPGARIARRPRLADRLPGGVSTTLQSLRRLIDRSYPLASVPSRRRRQFDVRRAGRVGYGPAGRALDTIGEFPTVFGVVADSRFLFVRRLAILERLAEGLPSGQCALEFLELHSLDPLQHWWMDRPEVLGQAYRAVDGMLRGLHERAARRGVAFMLLADHGQEPVFGAVPLVKELRAAAVPEADYSYFVEPTLARFWLHSEAARARLGQLVRKVDHARALSLRDLREMGLQFGDDAFGELFLAADPGWIFFPHDHHQPLLDLARGLLDPAERPRIFDPRLRGAHGYLPEHPSERGFVVLADPRFRARRPVAGILDVAPTLLRLLGETPPQYMRGQPAFG